jgi:hypothetical protein
VRTLPARVTLYFVLALWLCLAVGCPEVLRMLFHQLKEQSRAGALRIPSTAAAVQARRRLGLARSGTCFGVGAALMAILAPWGCRPSDATALLKVSVDGTRLDVADTPANRRHSALRHAAASAPGAIRRYECSC